MATKLGRFFRSVRHTPLRNLFYRLQLLVKRQFLVKLNTVLPLNLLFFFQKTPLLKPFQFSICYKETPQSSVQKHADGWEFDFLNEKCNLGYPIDWHRSNLNVGTRLWKLHLHYFDWCHCLSDQDFCEVLTDWIRSNHPYTSSYWKDSWNSYAISIRIVCWMHELQNRREYLTPEFVSLVEKSIWKQLVFLRNNIEKDIGGNHIIKNIKALVIVGKIYRGHLAESMMKYGIDLLNKELKKQILSDGFHFELSPSYHIQVFCDLLDIFPFLTEIKIKKQLKSVLIKMSDVIVNMLHPDGSVALFNDGGPSMIPRPVNVLATFEKITGLQKPDGKKYRYFPNAGYVTFNTPLYKFIYDIGCVGPDELPAHSHGDIHSFELSIKSKKAIVDAGVYEYNPGKKRSLSRSSVMHNTLTLDDKDQCEFWSSFRMGYRANVHVKNVFSTDRCLNVVSEHNGYARLPGNPIHQREINTFGDDVIKISDNVFGGKYQNAKIRFLFDESIAVHKIDKYIFLTRNNERIARIENSLALSTEIIETVYWVDFGVERKTTMLVYQLDQVPLKCESIIKIL